MIEFTARHLVVECHDTGQRDFTPEPLTGLEEKLVVDGVDHAFDYVEPLDADASGKLSAQVQIPEDLAPGAKVKVGVSANGVDYLSAPITIVEK